MSAHTHRTLTLCASKILRMCAYAAWKSEGEPQSGSSSGSWWNDTYAKCPHVRIRSACFRTYASREPDAMAPQRTALPLEWIALKEMYGIRPLLALHRATRPGRSASQETY